MFQIAVTFSLREGEENTMKDGVNSFGREHGYECAKPMKMEGGEDIPGKFCQKGGVVVEFCQGKELYPFSQVVGTKDAEISFELLIGSFSLSISLRMVGSGEANIVFEESSKFLSEGRSKLRALVRDESVV